MDGREVRVERGGVSLRVVVSGPRGPLAVLVHGSQGHAGVWLPVLPAFHAAGLRTACLDQRGHGGSGRAPAYRVEDYVEDLVAALEALGAAAVVGHSTGGLHAILAAARRPGLVRAVVHVDIDPAPPSWQEDFLHQAGSRPLRAYGSPEEAVAHLLPRLAPGADPARVGPAVVAGLELGEDGRLRPAYDPATLRDFGPYDVRDVLPRLGARLLVVRGRESRVMTDAGERDFRAARPDLRFALVPGGHHPFWDAPEAFCQAVVPFLVEALG